MNESSVIVRLRLLGASTFARGASSAGRGLATLDRNGRTLSRSLGGVSSVAGRATAALRLLGAAAATAGVAGLVKGVGASVNFEQAMANVQARLLTTKANMNALASQAIKLGGKTAFSANEAAQAMGEFAAAGFRTREIMKIMPGTLDLAAASGEDLAFSAETTGALIRQFGLDADDATHVADLLTVAVNKSAIGMDDLALTMKYVGPVAGRFGQSMEDIGASAAILGNVGIKGETAGTTLRRTFVNLVRPSTRTIDMLSGMGITVDEFAQATTNAKGDLRAFPTILGNLSTHLGQLTKPDQRKALAQLFGVEALPGMLTLMGMGQRKIDKMSASLTHSGGAAEKTAGIMRGTVKGAWDQFTGSLETASIRLTRSALPSMRQGLLSLAGATTKASKAGEDLIAGLSGKTPTPVMTGSRGDAGQGKAQVSTAQKVGSTIRGVVGDIAPIVAKLGKSFIQAGGDLIDAFKPAMPFLENVLLPLLKGVAIGVAGGVITAFKALTAVVGVVSRALGWLGTVLSPLKGVFQGIGTVIGFLTGGPILGLLGKLPKLGGAFRLLGAPIRIATSMMKGVFSIAGKVVGVFGKVFTAATRIGATLPGIWRKVSQSVGNFVGGIINKVEGIVTTIKGLGGKLVSAGGSIIKSIGRGIASAFGSGAGFILDIGSKLTQWLNDNTPLGDNVHINIPIGPDIDFNLPALATGGVIRRGGAALVGERGPELVSLPTGSTVYDNRTSRRASAQLDGGNVFYLTANLHLSGKQVWQEVMRIDQQMAEAA